MDLDDVVSRLDRIESQLSDLHHILGVQIGNPLNSELLTAVMRHLRAHDEHLTAHSERHDVTTRHLEGYVDIATSVERGLSTLDKRIARIVQRVDTVYQRINRIENPHLRNRSVARGQRKTEESGN